MAQGALTGVFHYSFDNKCDFKQFAKAYARQYGAYIMARDEPYETEITDDFFKVPSYIQERIDEANEVIERFKTNDETHFLGLFEKYKQDNIESCTNTLAELKDQIERVNQWELICNLMTPASNDHKMVLDQMLEDIRETKQRCVQDYEYITKKLKEVKAELFTNWRNEQYHLALKDVEYYTAELKKQEDRQQERKTWHQGYILMIDRALEEYQKINAVVR